MKRISFWLSVLVLAAVFGVGGTARAQDAATQQQIDKLSGQLQDILDAQAAQGKRIDALEKQVADLSDKLNQPAVNNSASADDLKKLAAQVQEIDQKRQADNQKILDQLEKISRLGAGSSRRSTPAATESAPAPAANIPQTGHYYTIQEKDTLSGIAKKYRAEGVKVSVDEILAANPGLRADSLIVGKKIFIPDAGAK